METSELLVNKSIYGDDDEDEDEGNSRSFTDFREQDQDVVSLFSHWSSGFLFECFNTEQQETVCPPPSIQASHCMSC